VNIEKKKKTELGDLQQTLTQLIAENEELKKSVNQQKEELAKHQTQKSKMEVISKLQDQYKTILTKIETQLNNKLPESIIEQSLNELESNTLDIIDIYRTIQIFQIDFTTLFNESDFISTSEDQKHFLKEVTQNYCSQEEENIIKEAIARNVNNLNETRIELKKIYIRN